MKRTSKTNILQVIGGAMFTAAFMVALLYFAGILKAGSSYTVSAYVQNARGIANDSTVFEAGLPVGLVTGVRRTGPDAIVTLRIDHGVRPLPVDSKVQLGLRSLAGETDLLLTPGQSSKPVPNNGSLGLSQSQDYTEVDQILNELAGPTEDKARAFFQGIGTGLAGQGANLNRTLGGFAGLVNYSPPITSTIAAQHNQVADIVQNFANIMNAVGQRSHALNEFALGARATFDAMATRDEAIGGFVAHLPAVLGTVAPATYAITHGPALADALKPYSLSTFAKGAANVLYEMDPSTPPATTLVDNLTTAMQRLGPAIDLLTPAASRGIKLVNALGGAAPQLRGILRNLEQTSPSATKALPALHALMCQANPMIRFLQPYGPDISAFFENFGAVTDAYGAAGGHELMASATVDPTDFVRGVENQPTTDALTTLFNFGIFKKLNGQLGYHALQGPGNRNDTTIGANVRGPIQWGATHPYPHVTADCAR